jgi:hypothetical protein
VAVTLAQFRIEYPEFDETGDTLIQPRLDAWNDTLNAFGDLHDQAVYKRTALDLSETVFGLSMAPNSLEPDKYEKAWDRILRMSYRRAQISGGGLT